MEPRIVLDEGSFKALSAGSRVSILKNLRERRKTLSELSRQLSLGASTVKEHCDILRKAGLIILVDEGRKWKYYSLTKKGQQIVAPSVYEGAQFLVMLCIGALAFSFFVFMLLQSQTIQNENIFSAQNDAMNSMPLAGEKTLTTATAPSAQSIERSENTAFFANTNALLISQIVAATLIAGLFIGWIARGKK
ncbi:MAG: winged helix-turn-helix domain-containing protein [archaeon]|jgi:DNA-binding transcriptional ArsR family regulator